MAGTDKFLFDLLSDLLLLVAVLTDQNTYSVIVKIPIVSVGEKTNRKTILLVAKIEVIAER